MGTDATAPRAAQRLALAVHDAHDAHDAHDVVMSPDEVVAFVAARTVAHRLVPHPTTFRRRNAAIAEEWRVEHRPRRPQARHGEHAVRDAIERARRQPGDRARRAEIEAIGRASDQRRAAHATELQALHRVIGHAFPTTSPKAVVLVDVASQQLTTLLDDELPDATERILSYNVVTGVDIRGVLRALGVDPVRADSPTSNLPRNRYDSTAADTPIATAAQHDRDRPAELGHHHHHRDRDRAGTTTTEHGQHHHHRDAADATTATRPLSRSAARRLSRRPSDALNARRIAPHAGRSPRAALPRDPWLRSAGDRVRDRAHD